MSSRLFLTVREERGLAYDVHSYLVDYADAGALIVERGRGPREDPWGRSSSDPRRARAAARRAGAGGRAPEGQGVSLRPPGAASRGDAPPGVVARRPGGPARGASTRSEEATAEIEAVDAAAIQRVAGELFVDAGLRLSIVAPPRAGRGLDAALACRARGMTTASSRGRRAPRSGPPPSSSRASISGPAPCRLARAELEAAAGDRRLDDAAIVDLAEARWRTGDSVGAGRPTRPAARPTRTGRTTVGPVIAARGRRRGPRRCRGRRRPSSRRCSSGGRLPWRTSSRGCLRPRPAWPDGTTRPARPYPAAASWRAGHQAARSRPSSRSERARAIARAVGGPVATTTDGHAADPQAAFTAGSDALAAGDRDAAALHLAVALRLSPALAPAILSAIGGHARARVRPAPRMTPSASWATRATPAAPTRPSRGLSRRGLRGRPRRGPRTHPWRASDSDAAPPTVAITRSGTAPQEEHP